ncbi:hypothetical protein ACOMHN_013551 [Nucella lapillus]
MERQNGHYQFRKKKGIKVASDHTTIQRAVLKEHRDRGLYAYHKAGKLIVTDPLRTRENRSITWQHSDEARKQRDVNSKKSGHQRSFPHPSDVADIGPSTLLKTSKWPALRTPRGDRPANPPKRPCPTVLQRLSPWNLTRLQTNGHDMKVWPQGSHLRNQM